MVYVRREGPARLVERSGGDLDGSACRSLQREQVCPFALPKVENPFVIAGPVAGDLPTVAHFYCGTHIRGLRPKEVRRRAAAEDDSSPVGRPLGVVIREPTRRYATGRLLPFVEDPNVG